MDQPLLASAERADAGPDSISSDGDSWSRLEGFEETGRLVIRRTPVEVSKYRQQLAQFDDAHLPEGNDKGMVLADVIVVKRLAADKAGQPAWLVRPEHIYFGRDRVPADGLRVVSPVIDDGGVILDVGGRYRIVAGEFFVGKFYVWEASVLKLQ